MAKNILFIGGVFSKENEQLIITKSKGAIQFAADVLQKNFIKGLDFYFNKIKIINAIYIGSFPLFYKDIIIKRKSFQHSDDADDVDVSFINLPIIKNFSRYFSVKREILKNIKVDQENIIFVYAMHTAFLKSAVYAKSKFKNTKICLIVPDLPDFMNDKESFTKKILKNIDKREQKKILGKVDLFVILSKYMVDKLEINDKPWVVVEGIYDSTNVINSYQKEKKFTILYTGTLSKRYGILDLLDTFKSINNSDFHLWICGDGDGRLEVENLCQIDSRVQYWGQLPHDKILELQKRAHVLVNPRKSEEFTKYSFPSKTMEYLASGTPTVMYPLLGIPDEYFSFCFLVNPDEEFGLKNSILDVYHLTQNQRDIFGKKAQEYILKFKNPKMQVGKIVEYLC